MTNVKTLKSHAAFSSMYGGGGGGGAGIAALRDRTELV